MHRSDAVTILPFIGTKQAKVLSSIEITTIKDLLDHFPYYYKDSSAFTTLDKLNRSIKQTVKVEILELKNIRTRYGKFIQKGLVGDETGSCPVTWFNQPYLTKSLRIGTIILLSGKLDAKSNKPLMISPEYEVLKEENLHLGKIVPVYRLTKGLSVKWLRARLAYLIKHIDEIDNLHDMVPVWMENENDLIALMDAYKHIHLPDERDDIIKARKRLAFSELLEIYIKLMKEREKRAKNKAYTIDSNIDELDDLVKKLPFKLTLTQLKGVEEILSDLTNKRPMYRLLQGDVGSGKTIVALLAALSVIKKGLKVVLMAPTSVLANQHFNTANKFLGDIIRIGLLTGDKRVNEPFESDLLIATHAVLYHKDEFVKDLALLIIDEQHRFGVEQRRALLELKKEYTPHLLHLTATPIPRSIALTLFGEIDVSVIEKPALRKVSETKIVPNNKREDSYSWIQDKIKEGGQVFWICPLIEEGVNENDDVIKVTQMYEDLNRIFPNIKKALLHGKMKDKDKQSILKEFEQNKVKILVSTTVVEVGIDVPNANIMIIENAERYGLAQLHQLRGRVGRNDQESWCLLYTPLMNNDKVIERLRFFAKENEGIKIAEFDLENRGPGEVYGTIQSGIPVLRIANFGNRRFLEQVRSAAIKLLNK